MGIVQLFVPMAGMLMIVAIAALITRTIAMASLNKTIREALRSDPGSIPVLASRLEPRPLLGDYLLGWIFLALAVGMALLAITEPDEGDRPEMLRAAIVPALVGATVLAYSWFAQRSAAR